MVEDLPTHNIMVHLDRVYFGVCCSILSVGFISIVCTLRAYWRNRGTMNTVIKAYASCMVTDSFIVLNFLSRDLHHVTVGKGLTLGPWCNISAVVALTACTAMNGSVVIIAWTTYKVMMGSPPRDGTIIQLNAVSWLLALAWSIGCTPYIGSYKDIYCCLREDAHTPQIMYPFLILFMAAVIIMALFYWKIYALVRQKEECLKNIVGDSRKASSAVLRRGMLLVGTYYMAWGLMFINGFLTMYGHEVPVLCDMFAAWFAKTQPTIDSIIILSMFRRLDKKDNWSATSDRRESMAATKRSSIAPVTGATHRESKIVVVANAMPPAK